MADPAVPPAPETRELRSLFIEELRDLPNCEDSGLAVSEAHECDLCAGRVADLARTFFALSASPASPQEGERLAPDAYMLVLPDGASMGTVELTRQAAEEWVRDLREVNPRIVPLFRSPVSGTPSEAAAVESLINGDWMIGGIEGGGFGVFGVVNGKLHVIGHGDTRMEAFRAALRAAPETKGRNDAGIGST